jgi:hypothetical protein
MLSRGFLPIGISTSLPRFFLKSILPLRPCDSVLLLLLALSCWLTRNIYLFPFAIAMRILIVHIPDRIFGALFATPSMMGVECRSTVHGQSAGPGL